MRVALVDAGGANIGSVLLALQRLGVEATLTGDARLIREADRVILPGVSTAPMVMGRLRELDLVETLRTLERPLLGVCLGQQLLFDASDEGDGVDTLGLIPGHVSRFDIDPSLPVPHMGWSRLEVVRDDPLLEGIQPGDWAYFVHSFVCPDGPATLARADYGTVVPAVVRNANRWGCQFHPERSAKAGARILQNFLGLPA